MIENQPNPQKRNIFNPKENAQVLFKDIILTQISIGQDEYFWVKFFIGFIVGSVFWALSGFIGSLIMG